MPRKERPSQRRARSAALAAAAITLAAACAPIAQDTVSHSIVIDGAFDDWRNAPVIDDDVDATARVDFRALSAAADGEAVYVRFTTTAAVVLQQLEGSAHVLLDLDGSPATGEAADGLEGVDVTIVLTPGVGAWAGGGVGVRAAGDSLATADAIGYIAAPTHGADAFEVRIERAAVATFAKIALGDSARVRLASYTPDGEQADATSTLTFAVPPAAVPATAQAATTEVLARAPEADVRVVQWNVADQGIVARAEPFARIVRGLNPDVLLLDELPRAADEALVRAFLAQVGGEWHVVVGDGGGRQRAAVASRLPLEPAPAFGHVAYADSVRTLVPLATRGQTRRDLEGALEDGVSAAGAVVEIGGARILFAALDLACCGGQDDVEDRLRRMQADAVRAAVRRTLDDDDAIAGVIVAGDLNLVGSALPLDILASDLDPAGADLAVAHALQLDGRTVATWRSPGQAFPPGRLDWLLYTPSLLGVVRAFAFEAVDAGEAALRAAGIDAEDSERTSDHLPLVVDLRVK
jgi:exonuclease III